MDLPRSKLPILKFSGLATNQDRHDLEPGQMMVQSNLEIFKPGKLVVRNGLRPAVFDNAIVPSAVYDAISIAYFRVPEADYIIYEDTNGNLKLARNPT